MKIVGLRIADGLVSASIVEKGLWQSELKGSFSLAYSTDTELVEILREKSREWSGARIVSSIPGGRFSQRSVTLPFNDRKRIEKALPFELEDNVPFALEDMQLDHLALGQPGAGTDKKKEMDVIGLMVPKTVLRQHLELLASAGIDPQVIVPSYIGLYFVSRMVPFDGNAVLIAGSDLCTVAGNTITACRSFSETGPTAGINHTLKALELEGGARVEKAYLLSPSDRLSAELAEGGITAELVTPEFRGQKSADPESLGLAFCDQINFRQGEFSYRRADTGVRKQRRTLVIAGAVAVLLATANIGVKYYLVQSNYGKLDQQIKEIYRQTFPDAKTVVDPLRQLRTKLDEAKNKFGVIGAGTSALDVMKAVTEGIPKEIRVSFQEFNLEGDRLKLQGDAASFESIDKMKAELQKAPAFSEVAVLDTRMGVDNKVKFRFDIKLKQTL